MSVTVTGLAELKRAIETLPADVTAALRSVAWRKSREALAIAKSTLRSKLKTPAHKLIDNIEIIEQADKKQFVVISQAPDDQPANLPLWVERGTRHMAARPYIRPAADAIDASYKSESVQAATAVVNGLEQF